MDSQKHIPASAIACRELKMTKDRQYKIDAIRHDLVNILTMIRGYAELTLMRESLDPVLGGYSRQIVIAVDRAFSAMEHLNALYASTPGSDLPTEET